MKAFSLGVHTVLSVESLARCGRCRPLTAKVERSAIESIAACGENKISGHVSRFRRSHRGEGNPNHQANCIETGVRRIQISEARRLGLPNSCYSSDSWLKIPRNRLWPAIFPASLPSLPSLRLLRGSFRNQFGSGVALMNGGFDQ